MYRITASSYLYQAEVEKIRDTTDAGALAVQSLGSALAKD